MSLDGEVTAVEVPPPITPEPAAASWLSGPLNLLAERALLKPSETFSI
jgi:hypothetical protein